jgi:hypothetical protein
MLDCRVEMAVEFIVEPKPAILNDSARASAYTSMYRRQYRKNPNVRSRFISPVTISREVPMYSARTW